MAVTSYVSMDGMLIGEITGGVMRNYGTDALGSVVDTASNGVVENTYRYKPYGGTLAKTGTAADPSFLWNGGSGYRATTLGNSGFYVRRRHFSPTTSQWTTLDLLWPSEYPFLYVGGSPATVSDPSGLLYWKPSCCASLKSVTATASQGGALPGVGWSVLSFQLVILTRPRTPLENSEPVGLMWYEKANETYPVAPPPMVPDRYSDVTTNAYLSFPNFTKMQADAAQGCPPTVNVLTYTSKPDTPTYYTTAGAAKVRCLCIAVTFFDGCSGSAWPSFSFNQSVSFQTNPPVVVWPSDPLNVSYCSTYTGSVCSQKNR